MHGVMCHGPEFFLDIPMKTFLRTVVLTAVASYISIELGRVRYGGLPAP